MRNLGPGEWLHRIHVSATNQLQFRRELLVADPATPNRVRWAVFKSVKVVTSAADSGPGSLRDAVSQANGGGPSSRPWLIRFDHAVLGATASIELTGSDAVAITAPGTAIDGTNAEGHPSPLAKFTQRGYPTIIHQNPTNKGLAFAARMLLQAADTQLIGLSIRRTLGTDAEISGKDQDLITLGTNSAGSRLANLRLDGGAAAKTNAGTHAAGKDCIDAGNTGATEANPIVVENSEIRFCYDRGMKSQSGYLKVERSWIHNNLRYGILSQAPPPAPTPGAGIEGVINATGNLVEQSGINCPSGTIGSCGTQTVARGDASEAAAQGTLSRLVTNGNIFRNGVKRGLYFPNGSKGQINNDFICGINNGSNGQGFVTDPSSAGSMNDIVVRGTAVVYNDDAGVRLEKNTTAYSLAANFGSNQTTDPGNNAFARHKFNDSRDFRFVDEPPGSPAPAVTPAPARGNQWQFCYPVQNPNQNQCSDTRVSQLDTNNTNNTQFDLVDVTGARAHAGMQVMMINSVFPKRALKGAVISITGAGFDAISGLINDTEPGGLPVGTNCTSGLNAGNKCNPLSGMCVEFDESPGVWRAAEEVLAVTPTQLVVRNPIDCRAPVRLRIRRKPLSSPAVTFPDDSSPEKHFCLN